MALKPGDILEIGIWMDGRETEEMKAQFVKDANDTLQEAAKANGVRIGPLTTYEAKPGDERMPEVPDDLQGPDVRMLVGEAPIIGLVPKSEGNFVADLEPRDLERLVKILRRVHRSYNPGKPELPIEKCYEYININGPEAALDALREQVGVKVH